MQTITIVATVPSSAKAFSGLPSANPSTSAIRSPTAPWTLIAIEGVRWVGWMRAIAEGSTPMRPSA